MLTEYEAQKIHAQMYKELNAGPRAAWQCAAGLALIITLAVAGVWHDPKRNSPSAVAQAQERSQAALASHDDLDAQTFVRIEAQPPADARSSLVPVASAAPQVTR